MRGLLCVVLLSSIVAVAQNAPEQPVAPEQSTPAAQGSLKQVTVPAGTEVPLTLKSAIDTKNTRVGDGVYCQTAFPVVVDNVIVIPAGTYVKGEVVKAERAGRIKGRAQILFRF
ncbi:MAG TPA: hypothetical protein VJW55_10720, partial [Candidatus Angelobacter sp.]|nr:hypothetical protein [Candidatus Angelobacter sp.]